ncbi:carbohydrate porin [Bdellovibrio sp. ArHS]|uniref:carbohydrate porin n=1 Tax=Bdellovibrio sp. ArHS TaxID=1569284 RepID=UPI0025C5AB78|nr:carbohydrate porin [Bdellovibrio sp. ArHS]
MKSIKCFLICMLTSSVSFALNADFIGYLRGGTGINFEGGQQNCFFNSGIPGNFLRLGNECGFYSELAMIFHHKKPEEQDSVYFRTQVRLMFNSKGTRQWEAAANRDMSQVEAFVTAGGFTELPGEFWIGKRFYRDVDLYIFDWYYYADMSGVGAGIDNIPVDLGGKVAVAHLVQANDDLSATTAGRPVLQAVDLRWKTIPVFAEQNLNLWGVYAWAQASSDGTSSYIDTNGFSLSARLNGSVFDGNNNTTILYGKGAMKDLNIYASSAVPSTDDSQNKAWTLRFVEDWNHDVTDRWAVMLAVAAEIADTGKDENSHREWQEIGIRPIYFVSDRFQWVFETGYSRFKDESEVDGGGNSVGVRELSRISLAPQLSLSKTIWGRPVMRAFVSHSMWSNSNKSLIGASASAFKDKTAGTSFGYQFEAWF